MTIKVVVTPRSFAATSPLPLKVLEERGYSIVRNPLERPLEVEELLELVGDADALIVGIDKVPRKVIENAPRLRVISKYGVGVDNIDLEAAAEKGIIVTNTPDVNTEAVADLAVGLILAAARRIPQADASMRQGQWKKFMGMSLFGKTVGILGTGRIGRAVARRLQGFNTKLLLYDVCPDPSFAAEVKGEYTEFARILREADYISVHLPLLPETRNLIGEAELRLMKPDAVLINTSRGGIVEEKALARALRKQWIRAAALDVFAEEPPRDRELLDLESTVCTPHIGAYTEEAVMRMGLEAAENVISVLEGRRPKNVVSCYRTHEGEANGGSASR
ncbi:MAG TPA: hydroxyacid dehydrogenase [Peptococcaceae bacterium]|nr:hydroxyacid dehydrogenase [Peptococcaceae bacterium]